MEKISQFEIERDKQEQTAKLLGITPEEYREMMKDTPKELPIVGRTKEESESGQ